MQDASWASFEILKKMMKEVPPQPVTASHNSLLLFSCLKRKQKKNTNKFQSHSPNDEHATNHPFKLYNVFKMGNEILMETGLGISARY